MLKFDRSQFSSLIQNRQRLNDLIIRLVFFGIGFSPITAVSLSTFEFVPLHISGPLVVFPAIFVGIGICVWKRFYAMRVLEGVMLGIVAVTLYDLAARMPFLAIGIWPDFIPKLGAYLLAEEPQQSYSLIHWVLGYVWRYFGNGGGMGLAFYMIAPLLKPSWDRRLAGVLYGVGIFCCLLATLYLSPAGRVYLFDPGVFTGMLGFLGHVVYGLVLGMGVHLLQSPDAPLTEFRTSFVCDRKMQYWTGITICLVVVAICVMNLYLFVHFSDMFLARAAHLTEQAVRSEFLLQRRTFMTVLGVTELFLVIGIFGLVIVYTNRIAGPIYNLRKQLALIRAGNLDHEMKLRPRDYLSQELADEYNETVQTLRKRYQRV